MKHFEIDSFFLMIFHKGLANIILYSANIYRWSYIEYTVQQRNTQDDDDKKFIRKMWLKFETTDMRRIIITILNWNF